MSQAPRILVFTGDGKGKTTAALGMALRASGHGMKVAIIQFVKADAEVGEVRALARNSQIEILQTGLGFLPSPADPRWADHRAAAEAGLRKATEIFQAARHEMVILDEACFAVARGLLKEADLIALLRRARPDSSRGLPRPREGKLGNPPDTLPRDSEPAGGDGCVCIVLTGRGATEGLIALADTVTEMRCVKHALQGGVPAQRGVEL